MYKRQDVKYLLLYFEQTYGLTSEKKMTAALSIVANENCYHPIQLSLIHICDQLAWVGGMNSIRSRAEEIILSEMIFV